MRKIFTAALLGMMFLVLANTLMVSAAENGIPIPYGENKTIWQLGTDPFTRFLGPYFFVILIGVFSGLIWIKTQSTGPALAFFVVVMGVLSASTTVSDFIPGDWAAVFMMFAILAAIPIFLKAFTK